MKRLFVLINHPVERRIPYVVKTIIPNDYVIKLYEKQHDEKRPFLSKKDIEFLDIFPMCGPRYSILKIDVPEMS